MSNILARFIRPSTIRRRIERDCREIECLLDALEHAARRLRERRGDSVDGTVRWQCEVLRNRLRRHADLQRAVLVPALRAVDAWGEQRARGLLDWLNRRHSDLEVLFTAEDGMLPPISRLVDYVRHDIERERTQVLHSELLRDDVVEIDVQTG